MDTADDSPGDTRDADDAEIVAADIAAAYVDALESADAETLVNLLTDRTTFVSPFSRWASRRAVAAACTARTSAFTDVAVTAVVREAWSVSVRWQARVGDTAVEGVDVLGLEPRGVATIDTFLRPAAALDEIYAAMKAAWPQPPA